MRAQQRMHPPHALFPDESTDLVPEEEALLKKEEKKKTFAVLENFCPWCGVSGSKVSGKKLSGKEMKATSAAAQASVSKQFHLPQWPTCFYSLTRSVLQAETHA